MTKEELRNDKEGVCGMTEGILCQVQNDKEGVGSDREIVNYFNSSKNNNSKIIFGKEIEFRLFSYIRGIGKD